MSYRSLGRRSRWLRGDNYDWFPYIGLYPAIALCWLEWLHPGSIAPILVQISSVVWIAFTLVMILVYPFLWFVNRHMMASAPQFSGIALMRKMFVGMPALFSWGLKIGVLGMFLLRHLDGALLCESLWAIFFILRSGWHQKDNSAILRACAEALLSVAVLFHSGGLAVAWAVVTPLAYHFFRPSLRAFLHTKFTRAEVGQEIRRWIDTQPWSNLQEKVYTGLYWFRNYELWEDARQWLEEYKESEVWSPLSLECWQTMIAIGQGQYELAPEMERLLPQMEQADKSWTPDEIRLTAAAYARLGKREDALRVINDRPERRRRQRSHCLADVHAIFGEWEMALSYYEASTRSAETLYGMATCLTRLGYQREAQELYRQAIILSMYVRLDYLRDLAECCRRVGDDRMALEAERLIFEKGG